MMAPSQRTSSLLAACVILVSLGVVAADWNVLYPFGVTVADDSTERYSTWSITLNQEFDVPFYGFRYNYTMINTDGHVAFSRRPEITTWPLDLPNPNWPHEFDHAFIAPFYTKVGFRDRDPRSNVWYRAIRKRMKDTINTGQEDPLVVQREEELIDKISDDIHWSIVGASDFEGRYAVLVTWDNVTFAGVNGFTTINGQPKPKPESEIPRNTFQLVLITDEVRTYAVFNYADINWVSCPEYGADPNFGIQGIAATVGFNGGNGTNWHPFLPYNQMQSVVNLDIVSNVFLPGRWVFRVDEEILRGGCTNETTGPLVAAPSGGSMLGGEAVNVSGPCFKLEDRDNIKCRFQEIEVKGHYINATRARCIAPRFDFPGWVRLEVSRDGGKTYRYATQYYVSVPSQIDSHIFLKDFERTWQSKNPEMLEFEWDTKNLTYDPRHRLDIGLWGYWEEPGISRIELIDIIAEGELNDGFYQIQPQQLTRERGRHLYWRYDYGFLRINISEHEFDMGHYWSQPVPLAWYYQFEYERYWGNDWPNDFCQTWNERDRQKLTFLRDLPMCPCNMVQAMADKGRWIPDENCDRHGKLNCYYNERAQHCVKSAQPSWQGAAQQCCYDKYGELMSTKDFLGGGKPARAHPYGSYPFRLPPRIPTLSHYQNDLMPYYYCCIWGTDCTWYTYLRPSDECHTYMPPKTAVVYGDPHIQTFDGLMYSLQLKGEYQLLRTIDSYKHKLNIQGRFEQPLNATFGRPNATILTSVAMRENQSDIVEIQVRQWQQQWRYHLTVLVNGVQHYFDRNWLKYQRFDGLTIYNPYYNLNQSDIIVMFDSGAAMQVQEAHVSLHATLYAPRYFRDKVRGLFGTWNETVEDDLMTMEGMIVRPPAEDSPAGILDNHISIAREFGAKWRLVQKEALFTYKPGRTTDWYYDSQFMYLTDLSRVHPNASFTMTEVNNYCGDNHRCRYDYLATGDRKLAVNTMEIEAQYRQLQQELARIVGCGALRTPDGGEKNWKNYLVNSTVRFTCRPGYHMWFGSRERTCMHNGKWSPGEMVVCWPDWKYKAVWGGVYFAIAVAALIPFALCFGVPLFIIFKIRGSRKDHYVDNRPRVVDFNRSGRTVAKPTNGGSQSSVSAAAEKEREAMAATIDTTSSRDSVV